jgi:hypothetical protein
MDDVINIPRIIEIILAFAGISPFALVLLARFLPKKEKRKNQDRY